MTEHYASITVNAPVHQVYTLFTHFNDFPKFMSFVKEVTYYDEQRSHWVAEVAGTHEWDAVNEEWIPDRQIGWRSTAGLQNTGKVKFTPLGPERTMVDVYINYTPPVGLLGKTAETLGVDSRFEKVLQEDLNNFTYMIDAAPPDALDPMQSHYLFHSGSAVRKGTVTQQQREAMDHDPMMQPEALRARDARIEREKAQEQEMLQKQKTALAHQSEQQRQAAQEQETALQQQAELDRQAARKEEEVRAAQQAALHRQPPDPIHDTLGGRNASMARTPLGERDARSARFPQDNEDPMLARSPVQEENAPLTPVEGMELESPWRSAIRGQSLDREEGGQVPLTEEQGHRAEEQRGKEDKG